MNTKLISRFLDRRGFTLLELLTVMAIIALLSSLAMPLFIDLDASASQKALRAAVAELNSRERMVWLNIKNSQNMWIDDVIVFYQIDTDLGAGYHWRPNAEIDGGKLHFKNLMIKLKRIPSTATSAGKWEIIFSSSRKLGAGRY